MYFNDLSFRPGREILYLNGISTNRFLGYHIEMTYNALRDISDFTSIGTVL